jgi:single-strand DNA-binding protein
MPVSVNRVIIAGNLTRDPQTCYLANEKAVANFGLAINSTVKAADGTRKDDTVFVDVEAWGRTAELVGQYLSKGRACLVDGRLKFDAWDKDGVKHTKLRVVADSVQFLDSGQGEGERPADRRQPAPGNAPAATGHAAPPRADDEPPF